MTSIVVTKDRINLIESERYIAGSKNAYQMTVSFSTDWKSLTPTIIFRTPTADTSVSLLPIDCGCPVTFDIPNEVFAQPASRLQVGVYGTNDTNTLNTRWLSLGRVAQGVINDDCCCSSCPSTPSTPTPDSPDYEHLIKLIDSKADNLIYEDEYLILRSGEEVLSAIHLPALEANMVLSMPVGAVIPYAGSLDTIPLGYSLCDGQNGTIDLRNSFIIGASEETPVGPINKTITQTDSDEPYIYALAFIQKTSLTSLDKKQGQSAYEVAVENGFKGSEAEWLESLKGPKGDPGKSAYEVAVDNGFQGDEADWIHKLESSQALPLISSVTIDSKSSAPADSGDYIFKDVTLAVSGLKARTASTYFQLEAIHVDTGVPSQIIFTTLGNTTYTAKLDEYDYIVEITQVTLDSSGGESIEGPKGDPGDSAYQIAVQHGFIGSEEQWLESLKGKDGEKGADGSNGKDGQPGENGVAGKSAYEIAKEYGFHGSEEDWLQSLIGEPGKDGKSVQMIQDYSEESWVIVGRWYDNKPVKRKVIQLDSIEVSSAGAKTLTNLPQNLTVVTLSATATFHNGDVIPSGITDEFVAQLPAICDGIWFSIRYYPNEADQSLCLYTNGIINSPITLDLTIVVECVNPADDELSDDDLIVGNTGAGEEGGTSDHRKLVYRDSFNQHPISAITDLTSSLSARPSKKISDDLIDNLFK